MNYIMFKSALSYTNKHLPYQYIQTKRPPKQSFTSVNNGNNNTSSQQPLNKGQGQMIREAGFGNMQEVSTYLSSSPFLSMFVGARLITSNSCSWLL